MSDLSVYLHHWGRLPFSVSPFNEIDGLLFSLFSYIDYSGIVGGAQAAPLLLKQAAPAILEQGWQKKYDGVMILPKILKLFEQAKSTRRFGRVLLWNYEAEQDKEKEMQFAAVSFLLPTENKLFCAFRGTDSSIVGWKEDFNLLHAPVIPSQERASAYFNKAVSLRQETVLAGGHSKGGNLAHYAAIHSPTHILPRISGIYDYDSPCLPEEIQKLPTFAALRPKMNSFVPQSSIVGMLMRSDDNYTVVKSRLPALMQHDPTTWQIRGRAFVRMEGRSKFGQMSGDAINSWMQSLSEKERQQFVTSLFSILEATNANRFMDLGTDSLQHLSTMIKTYRQLSDNEKKLLVDSLKTLVRSFN